MLEQRIQQQFFDGADLKYQAAETLSRPVAAAASALLATITGGGRVLIAGVGHAFALALYAASRFVDRFERERPPLAALALAQGADAPKQVHALGEPGDVLLLVDDGEPGSQAAAQALVDAARAREMTTVVLAARGTPLAPLLAETDVLVEVPHERGLRVLEVHLLTLHCLGDAVDMQLMGEQYS
jgi:D-sedoheptulose 7-phosphate isomerase